MSEWVEYADRSAWAEGVARACAWAIERGYEHKRPARAALAGGSTPAAVYPLLFAMRLNWAAVELTVSDERVVSEDDPLSNIGALRRAAAGTLAAAAHIVSLETLARPEAGAGPLAAGTAAPLGGRPGAGQVRADGGRYDLIWAGCGEDGHALGWFHGPDRAAWEEGSSGVARVRPDPPPASTGSVPRLTLTRTAAARAHTIILAATGHPKRAVLETAADKALPVAHLLSFPQTQVHWAP
ncbi:MAG: 6-phosphogluconolactonase [Sphingomonadaceae bacterium]|nr:6-phosphogluconolactonase [Sphingomonadaceae bacterium]